MEAAQAMPNPSKPDFDPQQPPRDEGAPHTEAGKSPETQKPKRGTAAMDPETRKQVARKGGLAVSKNREHMALIGKKGGQSISRDREHMARIGKKGGESSRATHKEPVPLPGLTTVTPLTSQAEPGEEAEKKTGTE
jgi:general stress protein YciG